MNLIYARVQIEKEMESNFFLKFYKGSLIGLKEEEDKMSEKIERESGSMISVLIYSSIWIKI